MPMIRRALVSVFACATLLVLAGLPAVGTVARAAEPEVDTADLVEVLAQEAKELVQAAMYEEAISRYMKAYQLQPAGLLLYNVAFIYDKKIGDARLATEFYRRYLRSQDPDVNLVRRTLNRLRELHEEAGPDDKGPSPTESGSGTNGGLIAGWIMAGTGTAVLAGGVGLGVVSLQTTQDYESASPQNPALKNELYVLADRQADQANILMGVGGVTMVAGVVLLFLNWGDDTSEARAQGDLAPLVSVTTGGVSVGLGGRW